MLDLMISARNIDYAFLYNGVRFHVGIKAEDLHGPGDLLQEFNAFKDDIDAPDTLYQFEEWILAPLHSIIEKEAPTPERDASKTVTLLHYFSPLTFAFSLVNKDGSLHAIQKYNPDKYGDLSPRTQIVDALSDSPPNPGNRRTEMILRSSLPHVPLIAASELERVGTDLKDFELSDIPKKVRRLGSSEPLFFKAGFKDHGHKRELDILDQIHRNAAKFDPPIRTSKLVVWDESQTCLMGFLLEYIHGKTLRSRSQDASEALRRKWMDQVEATVRQLHEIGIVWGDVKPDNVMIDSDEEAVVIDFGGGYTPEYIPQELQQTAQGDLIGLEHMRASMGI
ncbi:kinase-like domain [Fusarium albosuccineum]|uniref:Kinase-like domain n=1 Tax=Fusarium albosuccineum TaxID=1237068 RepID=A0A8H4PIM4_9HYPO|nr:kinase-like domain [Fusarium albosuccineum]